MGNEDEATLCSMSKTTKSLSEKQVAAETSFPRCTKHLGIFSAFWKYSSLKIKWSSLIGVLAAIVAGAARPCMTIIFSRLVNNFNNSAVIGADDLYSSITNNVVWYVYLFVLQFTMVYLYGAMFMLVSIHFTNRLRLAYMGSTLSQNMEYFEKHTPGEVATDLSSNALTIQSGCSERLGMVIQASSEVVIALIIAFVQSWKLSLVVGTTVVALFVCQGTLARFDARAQSTISAASSYAANIAEEALSTMRTIVAFNAQNKMVKRFATGINAATKHSIHRSPLIGLEYSLAYFVLLSAYALAYWYGTTLLLRGEIANGGKVVNVILCFNTATNALEKLLPALGVITKAKGAAKGFLEVIANHHQEETINPSADVRYAGHISFEDVTFAYPSRPDTVILKTLNLSIEAGKTTAIVGSSGSGKSTIVALLEKWYEPASGKITIDGNDIKLVDDECHRSHIGLVQQDPFLFNDSIYHNICHGLSRAQRALLSVERQENLVREICAKVGMSDFIATLPQGYDTVVGERGGNLSGGQRQRLAIARAIISNPMILILDEATSALDPTSEKLVQATLDDVSVGRTTLVISHRLTTVQKADNICFMSQGRITEHGPHDTLINQGGDYAMLIRNQSRHRPRSSVSAEASDSSLEPKLKELEQQDFFHEQEPHQIHEEQANFLSHTSSLSLLTCLRLVFSRQQKLLLWLLVGAISALAAGAVYPGQAIIFAKVVTSLKGAGDQNEPDPRGRFWSLMFLVLAGGVFVAFFVLGTVFTILGAQVKSTYQEKYFRSFMERSIAYFDRLENNSGSLMSRLASSPEQLSGLVSVTLGLSLVIFVNAVSSLTLAIVEQWKLALVAIFGGLPPIVLAGYIRIRLQTQSYDKTSKAGEEAACFASEAVGAMKTVSSLNLAGDIHERYARMLSKTTKGSSKNTAQSMALYAFSESARLLAMALTFWYGGKLLISHEVNAYQYFVIFIAIVAGGEAAGEFFANTNDIVQGHAAAKQILSACSDKDKSDLAPKRSMPESNGPNMFDFRGVNFKYPNREASALRGLNFTIKKGENLAIVGPSGSGKSTIVSLLARFYDPTNGSISVNGTPTHLVDPHTYRSQLSLVLQETSLYEGTIRDNIMLGVSEENVSGQEVQQACRDAHIHDFIISLPNGYSTICGNKGLALSGGQRQRIALARALVKKPQVLLLDEATNALDMASERMILDALQTTGKDRTTISIAHRLATVRNADRILVIVQGRLVEQGTHENLMKSRGVYWDMVLAQELDES